MLSTLVLICAANVSRSDCSPETAVTVVSRQATVSELTCGIGAQAEIASTLQLRPGEYLKIVCRRDHAHVKEAQLGAAAQRAP